MTGLMDRVAELEQAIHRGSFVVPPGHRLIIWIKEPLSQHATEQARSWLAKQGLADVILLSGIEGIVAIPKTDAENIFTEAQKSA